MDNIEKKTNVSSKKTRTKVSVIQQKENLVKKVQSLNSKIEKLSVKVILEKHSNSIKSLFEQIKKEDKSIKDTDILNSIVSVMKIKVNLVMKESKRITKK